MLIIEKIRNKENTYLIEMTRGDSLVLNLNLTQEGEKVVWDEHDEVVFALSESFKGKSDYKLLIKKDVTIDSNGEEVLELEPEETRDLVYDYDYNFQIKANFADGRVYTFIEGILRVKGEIR